MLILSTIVNYGGDYIIPPWFVWAAVVVFSAFKLFIAILREQRTVLNYICLFLWCICFSQLLGSMMPTVISFVSHYTPVNWRFIPFYSLIKYYKFYGYSASLAIFEYAKIAVYAFSVGALQRCEFKCKPITVLLPVLVYVFIQLGKLLFDYTYQFDFGRIIIMLIGYFVGFFLVNLFWNKLSHYFYKEFS